MMSACVLRECVVEQQQEAAKPSGAIRQAVQSQVRECGDRVDQENEGGGGGVLFNAGARRMMSE
jgi:hypothetical protein